MPNPTVPELMAYLEHRPHIAAVARDEQTHLLWCNAKFAKAFGTTPERLRQSDFYQVAGTTIVDERIEIMQRAIATNSPVQYIQVWSGVRSLTHVHPMAITDIFGTRGWFIMIEPLVLPSDDADEFKHVPRARIPHLGPLAEISRRQLEVLRLAAEGLTVEEMAHELHRSDKTVDNHLRELYKHLNFHNRAQLTRFAAEHGILAFSRDEWFGLVAAADLHPANRTRPTHVQNDHA